MDVDEEQFPASVACDSEGDLRLAVGEDKNEILVSSAVMRPVSTVFKVMLGPNFKEGNKLRSSSGPYDLPLPDDSYELMAILCLYLHFQSKATETFWHQPEDSQLKKLLLLIDKYDCYSSVQESLSGRIRSLVEDISGNLTRLTLKLASVNAQLVVEGRQKIAKELERVMTS